MSSFDSVRTEDLSVGHSSSRNTARQPQNFFLGHMRSAASHSNRDLHPTHRPIGGMPPPSPPMLMTPAQKQSTRQQLLDDLKSRVKGGPAPDEIFICRKDLKDVWNKFFQTDNLGSFLGITVDSKREQDLRANFLRLLSLMVWIDDVSSFPSILNWFVHRRLTDDDIPLVRGQLESISDISEATRSNFRDEQYVFCPVTIQEEQTQTTKTFEPEFRLPFDVKEQIGLGAFGECWKTAVPPGYLKDREGKAWPDAHVIAYKEFRNVDSTYFVKEIRALRLLQESIRRPDNIMVHFAAIYHRTHYTIILPYAAHGDLRQFLYHLPGSPGSKLAHEVFESLYQLRGNLFQQMLDVSEALKWLHHELRVPGENSVWCVHTDLSPSNIMIKDDGTPVGKWTIGDWGLSTLDPTTGRKHSRVQALGDLRSTLQRDQGRYSRRGSADTVVTIDVPNEKQAETYQAPEAEYGTNLRASRRSDVWSLVCIFSEVLAFALGGWETVNSFRDARALNHDDDRFCTKSSRLHPSSFSDWSLAFNVRSSVDAWLLSLPDQFDNDRNWIECCVGLIKKYLIIDRDSRPDSRQLFNDLHHFVNHYKTQSDGDRGAYACFLTKFLSGGQPEFRQIRSVSNPPPPPDPEDRINELPPTGLNVPQVIVVSEDEGSDSPQKIRATKLRELRSGPCEVQKLLETNNSPTLVSLCGKGTYSCYILPSPPALHIFEFDGKGERFRALYTVHLQGGLEWRAVNVCKDGHLLWGFSKSAQMHRLFLGGPEDEVLQDVKLQQGSSLLKTVEMSANGRVALLYRHVLVLTSIRKLRQGGQLADTFHAIEPYSYSSAKFSSDGRFLYAFSAGAGRMHKLEAWRLLGKDGTPAPCQTNFFESPGYGSPDLKHHIPLGSGLGCALTTADDVTFLTTKSKCQLVERLSPISPKPSSSSSSSSNQDRTTVRVPSELCAKYPTTLSSPSDIKHLFAFEAFSLLAIKRSRQGLRQRVQVELVEHDIETQQQKARRVAKVGRTIMSLSTAVDKNSQVALTIDEHVVKLLIANTDGSVHTVKFALSRPPRPVA